MDEALRTHMELHKLKETNHPDQTLQRGGGFGRIIERGNNWLKKHKPQHTNIPSFSPPPSALSSSKGTHRPGH
ncbi:unnamed protein product [Microthlaspi erraticum]|uniref:Uncharacterized protein n=1 Tax=Microthlaspi erraticum TaxID=1685480 RepID=A0A6D2KZ83_9BRAS|nr:unnamed protein product [Microthlaspi erraticum]